MTADGKLIQERERLMATDGRAFCVRFFFFSFSESDSFIF